MWGSQRDKKGEKQASAYFELARTQYEANDLESSAKSAEAAIAVTQSLSEKFPENLTHQKNTANALYFLGNVYFARRRFKAAIKVLNRSEAIYRKLDEAKFLSAAPLIADVQMRRARVMAAEGRGASAAVEADEAVSTYLALTGAKADHPMSRDLARILAGNGIVLAWYGDPDLAVGSADRAVRIYVTQRSKSGKLEISTDEIGDFSDAAARAALIHLQQGRQSVALEAAQVAMQLGAPEDDADFVSQTAQSFIKTKLLAPDESNQLADVLTQRLTGDAQRLRPALQGDRLKLTTFADALAQSGMDDGGELAAALTLPVLDCKIVTPSQRAANSQASDFARSLAGIAADLMPAQPDNAIRIGLEAHYLFAAASRSQQDSPEATFQNIGPHWGRLLIALSAAFEARRDPVMALDLAAWGSIVAQQLAPMMFMSSEWVHVVHGCIARYAKMSAVMGDHETAAEARAFLAQLDGSVIKA